MRLLTRIITGWYINFRRRNYEGNSPLIDALNERLSEELAAINQYFVHAELCEDWGYEKLQEAIKMRSIQEMKHAEKLIERILFLEGRPMGSNLAGISIGSKVDDMHKKDWAAEDDAIQKYNVYHQVGC